MEIADAAISPTQWQKSTYPKWAQEKITVIHDGIDTDRLKYNPKAKITLASNAHHGQISFKPGDEVLSYVARNLEPVRGFQMLMRTLPEVLRKRPNANAIIVGGDEVSYGHRAPNGKSWKEHLMEEVGDQLDMKRVHFVGKVPYQTYLDLLSISKVHAYWTTPFVLSWSFLEASLSGLPVVASNTAPVREFASQLDIITQKFFDIDAYTDTLINILSRSQVLRNQLALPNLNFKHCVAAQQAMLKKTMGT
jgi:glycosyltransferase involved in cell wall biosynthesis